MKSKIMAFVALLLIMAFLLLQMMPIQRAFAAAPPPGGGAGLRGMSVPGARPGYVPNQIIVKFKGSTADARRSAIKRSADVDATLKNVGPDGSADTQLLQLKGGVSVESAVAELDANPEVAYAEPNYIEHKTYTPTDPAFGNQWGLNNTGQTIDGQPGTPGADIDAVAGWDVEKGNTSPVTVAIIDTGGDLNHPDLSTKFVAGYNYAGISQYVDYYWDGSDYYYSAAYFGTTTQQQVAQSITGTGKNLTSIGLEFAKVGTPSTITVSVKSAISGGNLASYTVTAAEVPAGTVTYISKSLSSAVKLNNGTTYYIVVKTASKSDTNYYAITYNPAGDYPDNVDEYLEGDMWMYSGSWSNYNPYDLFFKTNANSVAHDDDGHGTHCAGIAAAIEGNATGGVGVSFGGTVMPVKVLDSSGSGSVADIDSGIDFAANNGAKVISMSLASSSFSQAQQDAIDHAHNTHGVIVFASAGNSGDSTINYPAGYANVVGVGATDNQDHYTSFSTYNAFVDLSAPGWQVYSTLPTYPCELNSWGYSQNYDYLNGTSMACPMAAGLGALVRSRYPTLTADQVQSRMQTYADDLGVAGRDDHYGYGRINAFRTFTNPLPTTTTISPTNKIAGQPGFTLTVNGTNFVSGLSKVRWNGTDRTTTYVNSTQLTAAITAADIATVGTASITVFNPAPGGGTSTPALTFTINESSNSTWYLAEGTSDYGFETYVTIQNPSPSALTAQVTYMTKTGPRKRPDIKLPAMSQTVINPRNDIGSADFSTKVVCKEGKTIAVDRRMIWQGPGAPSPEGHASIGVTAPAKTWYLAEGSSKWGFESWLLIQNPNAKAANCSLTYMIEGTGLKTVNHRVPANSRASFSMGSDVGTVDASIKVQSDVPVIAERSMYRNNRREGSNSVGTTTPAKDYYLAEGSTDWGFTTYVLVQNPNPRPDTVTITYMTPKGPVSQDPFTVPANSRKTISVNGVVPAKDLSTHVQGSLPLIAERSMYWGAGTPLGEACHDSIGLSSPHMTFYLPDGETYNGTETWTLVQNPNAVPVTVQITYMTPDGKGDVSFSETIPANSRKSFNMGDRIPLGRAAIMVTSKTLGKKIMVERSMYWNSRGAGTDTIGGYSD